MSDLSITAANVKSSINAEILNGVASVAVTAGKSLATNNLNEIVLDNASISTGLKYIGVALNDAAAGQPVAYTPYDSELAIGATVQQGEIYVVSAANAGGICPIGDLSEGDLCKVIALGLQGNKLHLQRAGQIMKTTVPTDE